MVVYIYIHTYIHTFILRHPELPICLCNEKLKMQEESERLIELIDAESMFNCGNGLMALKSGDYVIIHQK